MIAAILAVIQQIYNTLTSFRADYTTGRAANLDNLNAPISGISLINSVQTVTIGLTFINAGGSPQLIQASNTATITSVNTAKAFIVMGGVDTLSPAGVNNASAYVASVTLTNATTVTARGAGSVNGSTTMTCNVRATVVEYK